MNDERLRPPTGPAPAPAVSGRRGYLDWLRGLAVLIMIEWHTLDSWTVPVEKTTDRFWYFMLVGGFGAPIFLFLAGISIALASGGRARRGASPWEAAWPMVRRGGWIWVLAILFRVWAFVLSPGATLYGILKVDILNVMGPSISAAAALWGLSASRGRKVAWLVAAAVLVSCVTPAVRASTLLATLPDPLEWYFRPWPGRTTFTLFPWSGFVFAGAALGVLLDAARDAAAERRVNLACLVAGAAIGGAAFGASFLPSPFAGSTFWTSSPSFFAIRTGVLVALVGLAWLWGQRPSAARFSPLRQFGVTSLFVYWIHVEMVYGILSFPLHRSLALPWALVAFALFTALMLGASLLKSRLWDRPAGQPQRPAPAMTNG